MVFSFGFGYRLARRGVFLRRGCLVVREDFFWFVMMEVSSEFGVKYVYMSHDVLHLTDGGGLPQDGAQMFIECIAATFETSSGGEL